MYDENAVEEKLRYILDDLKGRPEISDKFPNNMLNYQEYMNQLTEYIEYASEYEVAYESVVCLLERVNFSVSSNSSIKLLELGLLYKYKTGLDKDKEFDFRI